MDEIKHDPDEFAAHLRELEALEEEKRQRRVGDALGKFGFAMHVTGWLAGCAYLVLLGVLIRQALPYVFIPIGLWTAGLAWHAWRAWHPDRVRERKAARAREKAMAGLPETGAAAEPGAAAETGEPREAEAGSPAHGGSSPGVPGAGAHGGSSRRQPGGGRPHEPGSQRGHPGSPPPA